MAIGSGMLIKQYAYDQARKNPGKEVKILSERELCKVFRVSRPTVRKALDELVNEGMLIIHKGKGTFTNPSTGIFDEHYYPGHKLSVGIVLCSGQNVVYDKFFWNIISEAGKVICRDFGNVRLIQTASDNEKLVEEILLLQLDALIWIHPTVERSRAIEMIQSSGMPVMCVNRKLPVKKINYVTTDFYLGGKNAAKYLLDKGHRNHLFIADTSLQSQHDFYNGYRDAFREYGVEFDERLAIENKTDIISDIQSLIKFKIDFTACFAMGNFIWTAIEGFKRAGVIDFRAKYETLTTCSSVGKYLDCAFVNINSCELGQRAALELDRLMTMPTVDSIQVELEPEVISKSNREVEKTQT